MKEIECRNLQTLKDHYPLLNKLISMEEILWLNPNVKKYNPHTTQKVR